jgi:hypothetical protein
MNDYEEKQRSKDAQYEAAWNNLTVSQRRQMAKHGITGPAQPNYRLHKPDEETYIEKVAASSDPDPGEASESGESIVDEEFLWSALRRLLALIQSQDNVRLSMDCFSLVTGMQYDGESMADIARRHGVTRAAVSKRCVELTDSLGLKPSLGMRKLTTRVRYGHRARNCHRRGAH